MGVYHASIEISGVDGCETPVSIAYQSLPDRVEIESVTGPNGEEIELTTAMDAALSDHIYEWLHGRFDAEPPSEAE